jgi:hypothetical protein
MGKERKLVKLKPGVHQELLHMATKRDVTIGDVVEYLLVKWGELQVFDDVPCKYCSKPLGDWTREEVLRATKDWFHLKCKPKEE